MRLNMGRWIGALALLAAMWCGVATICAAQAAVATPGSAAATPGQFIAPRFNVEPVGKFKDPWFAVTIDPGQSIKLTAVVKNTGTVPAALTEFATNAVNPPNGGFSAGDKGDKPTGPTRWLGFPAETFTLAPGEERNTTFSISVPAGTPPGFYVAAVVAQTSSSLEIPGTESLRQVIRSAVSVEITVPGRMTSGFTLGTPAFSRAGTQIRLDMPIKNTGTARLRPEGTLSITSGDGKKVVTAPVKMGSFYGGYSTSVRVVIPGDIPSGDYLVSLQLKDAETGTSASIKDVKTTLAAPESQAPPPFVVDQASVTPSGNPIQYTDVAATVTNNGQLIPTANVMLVVKRDGKDVEQYALAQNQALPTGQTKISQRYIPKDGWKPGKWTFQIVVSAVSIGTDTQTVLATIDVPGAITIP